MSSRLLNRASIALLLGCFLLCRFSVVPPEAAGVPVRVSLKAYASPGEILRIGIKTSKSIGQVNLSLLDQKLTFQASPNREQWWTLVGIDLETKPGRYSLKGNVIFQDGKTIDLERSLNVSRKAFPVQRITVNEKYVTLDPKNERRAEEEAKRLQAIYKETTGEKLWQGRYLLPVEGALTSGFGRRRIVNSRPRSPHAGLDLEASTGTPIRAANAGRVVLAEDLFFSGNTVILDHGLGLYTLYAHCSKMLVTAGTMVNKGDVIAEVGATGRVTGPHLHWACRLNEARVNPMDLTQSWME
jgi:murein DD-endopeptidase MepM/ murein hydrolase activator NlpD